jgi:broad specificity phosphatase PhoE
MKHFLQEISQKQTSGNVLIVTHGGTIGDVLRMLFTELAIQHKKEPQDGSTYIEISECSITIIANDNDNFTYSSIGDTSHLLPI